MNTKPKNEKASASQNVRDTSNELPSEYRQHPAASAAPKAASQPKDWTVNCRGIAEDGARIVHIYGSNKSDAVDVARMIEQAPNLKWQLGEADEMAGYYKAERDALQQRETALRNHLAASDRALADLQRSNDELLAERLAHQIESDRLRAIIEKDTLHIVEIEQSNDELLAACKSVVYTWEKDFKGMDTGYEGTPLELDYKQCKAAI
jgi:hypothetical protein